MRYSFFTKGVLNLNIIRFQQGDVLELKKPHPCGEKRFCVLRTGSDVRIQCLGCGRDMTLPREKLERSVKKVTKEENTDES
ncbi:MAG: DUF951 domain-containing protein [Ruminococcaceae bacterium]|nr:DUF951 domain-containing protein [Oscillospiraceae bacterium]